MKLKTKLRLLFLYFRLRRWWWRFTEAIPLFGKGIAERRAKALQKAYDEHLKTLSLGDYVRERMREERLKRHFLPPDPIGDDLGPK